MPSCLEFRVVLLDITHILVLDSLLEGVAGILDCRLLVSREFVAIVLKVLFGLEYHSIGVVDLVNPFLLSPVGLLVSLCLILHPLDFLITEAA